ncbi:MAG: hypothetical protein IMW89_07375 [Ktedonobacteraceae bacterium]|nr:hypothetical protein [Ktedonobacteraceae bacterium]
MRIESLPSSNRQTQGVQRREWLHLHSPQHLQQCEEIMQRALQSRAPGASRSTAILGAGACTEVPLATLARYSDEVVLVDFDNEAMRLAGNELVWPALRKKISLVHCDLSGDVSARLARIISRYDWQRLAQQGAAALFDAAAGCLEQCPVPDPPQIGGLVAGEFGLVISSLILSQLFSYPLLDMLDQIERVSPQMVSEQERQRRYQEAAQQFRIRIINAHLHLLRTLLDQGGMAVLISDTHGFVFKAHSAEGEPQQRRTIPLVPRIFSELVHNVFTVVDELHWEWITDLPQQDRPGRGYHVAGFLLQ